MKITVLTVSPPAVRWLPPAAAQINAMVPGAVELRIYYVAGKGAASRLTQMRSEMADADALFLDLMGAAPAVCEAVSHGCESCRGNILPYGASSREYLRLGAFRADAMQAASSRAPSMEAMKKMQGMAEAVGKILPGKLRDMRNYSLLMKYFQNACEANLYGLLLLLCREYGGISGLPAPEPPKINQPIALYSTSSMTAFPSLAALEATLPGNRRNVALLFSAYAYPTDTDACVDAIVRALSPFCNVYPIGLTGHFSEIEPELRKILTRARGGIDLILDCIPFRLGAGPMGGDADAGIRLLQDINAPFFHPFFLTRRTEKAWRDTVSGCAPNEVLISILLPELDGAVETIPVGAMSEPSINAEYHVEEFDLRPIDERLSHLADRVRQRLRLKQLPNREKKLAIICYNYPPGEGNLFGGAFLDTFESVAAILARLKAEGYTTEALTAGQLRRTFCQGRAVNSGKFDSDWDGLITMDSSRYRADPEVTAAWGRSPGDIMTEADGFRIPGLIAGNVFIGLQPTRGMHETDSKTYHDKTMPPHHQYAAFYQWIQHEFQADALLHVGTHGTLEFLKGKECGMSGDDWPDRLIGSLPHFYLYYCGNPSEAVIAKRRCHASLISYQPPVFEEGGLYGGYAELSAALDEYRQRSAVSPEGAGAALDTVQEKAKALGLEGDAGEIEAELDRMNHSLIPKGLHIFGTGYSEAEQEQYRTALLSLRPEDAAGAAAAAKRSGENHEMDGLMEALAGGYTAPRLAGDIFRNPEVLPAGYNLYQFDPRLVPSETAMRRGREICENTLEAYRAEHGSYPNTTAVIAWGLETSRTQGETVGQILAYLGVRIDPDSHIWDRRFRIVPPQELGRPRIDVTINICGFFRDMFGNLIQLLDDLLQKLFALEETDEENYFRANCLRRKAALMAEGMEESEAQRLATARIFGPKEGEYGTGLTTTVEKKDWKEARELGESFTEALRYAYGRDMNARDVPGLYADNLRCVDVVSQLRSNPEYEITDLDHYYEFFGGLSKSVELAKGRKASMYITDTTGRAMQTETVGRSIARGLRTRVLNPKWIDGMLAHQYHGAQKIAERFENVMGLAATTDAVDPKFYDDLESVYVKDEAMRKRMAENNPHAYLGILEQMLEYQARGYWDATEEQLSRIRSTYLALENSLEGMGTP